MTKWYYQLMNDEVGPLGPAELLEHVRSGQIKAETLIRKDDSQWVTAREVNGLFDAATKPKEQRLCPYCGHHVEKAPTTCKGCNRKLVLSMSSRLTEQNNGQKVEKPKKTKAEEIKEIEERTNRRDIIRYSVLLLFWIGLMVVAVAVLRMNQEGEFLGMDNQTAPVAVTIVAGVIAALGFVIGRLGTR